MTRITISLKETEKMALLELADKEFRDPRAQAALIIRTELERLGFLQTDIDDRIRSAEHANTLTS